MEGAGKIVARPRYAVEEGARPGLAAFRSGAEPATLLPDGSLRAGTVKGDLVRYDSRLLDGPPLFSRTTELDPVL